MHICCFTQSRFILFINCTDDTSSSWHQYEVHNLMVQLKSTGFLDASIKLSLIVVWGNIACIMRRGASIPVPDGTWISAPPPPPPPSWCTLCSLHSMFVGYYLITHLPIYAWIRITVDAKILRCHKKVSKYQLLCIQLIVYLLWW